MDDAVEVVVEGCVVVLLLALLHEKTSEEGEVVL